MELLEMIRGLVNSSGVAGCSNGLTVVEEKWVDMLQEYMSNQENKEESARLEIRRRAIVDMCVRKECSIPNGLEGLSRDYISSGELKIDKDVYALPFSYYRTGNRYRNRADTAWFVVTFKKDLPEILRTEVHCD